MSGILVYGDPLEEQEESPETFISGKDLEKITGDNDDCVYLIIREE